MKPSITLKAAILLGAFVLLGVTIVGVVLTRDSSNLLHQLSLQRLDVSADIGQRHLAHIFDGAALDLRLLKESRDLKAFTSGRAPDKEHVADLLTSMLLKHPWYTQVRLIGVSDHGRELVRVDRQGNRVKRTPQARLQQKGHRDYFRSTVMLKPRQVYFSPIGLNREYGKIEAPHQPTLHVASPLYANNGREVIGIIVINIDMRQVFNLLASELPPGSHLLVANDAGEYLVHPRTEYAFAFERGESHRVQTDFPGIQEADFDSNQSVQFIQAVDGLVGDQVVTFRQVSVGSNGIERRLLLGVAEPVAQAEGDVNKLLQRSFWVTGALAILAATTVLLLVWLLGRPLRQITHAVESFRGEHFEQDLPLNRNDEIGQLARGFHDMAARIQSQVEWLDAERARLHSLIETATDAIVLISDHGIMEQCNSAVSRLFGYERDEMLGNNVSMLMNPSDSSKHDGYLENYLKTGDARIIGAGREVIGRHKDGRELHLYLSVGEFDIAGRKHFTGILHDISTQVAQKQELQRQANTDMLTGIANRRYFFERLHYEVNRSKRYNGQLSMLLIDLDHLKQTNDQLGHKAGDELICRAVEVLKQGVRETDTLARFGGDEFAVLMPETVLSVAADVAQRLCDEAQQTPAIEEAASKLGFSIGVATCTDSGEEMVSSADKALYQAKAAGRGTVIVSES